MDQLHGGTLQEIVPDLYSLRMRPSNVTTSLTRRRLSAGAAARSRHLASAVWPLDGVGHWQFRAPRDNRCPQTLHSSVVEIPIMLEGGILHIEDDRLCAKGTYRVIRLHRHDNDHVLFFLDLHLINAFQPRFGNVHPV